MFCTTDVSKIPCLKPTNYGNMHKWFIIAYLFHYYVTVCKLPLDIKWWAISFYHFGIRHVPKCKPTSLSSSDYSHSDFMSIKHCFCCFPWAAPICLHILHCHSKGLSGNWADFRNLRFECLLNHWSDLSEINCNGFSFKSSLIWIHSFNQRHKTIFGRCIATKLACVCI